MRELLEVIEGGAQSVSELDRSEPSVGTLGRRIEHFEEKLDAVMGLIDNRAGLRKYERAARLEEAALNPEFPILFGNVLERELLGKYATAKPDYQTYIRVGQQGDFRASDLLKTFGLRASLPEVPRGAEYKQDKALSEGKVSITLKKYGRPFSLGWEDIVNDDLGAFNDVPQDLVEGALTTENLEATKLIADSTGPHASLYGTSLTHPIDGATINNLGTAVLALASLEAAIAAMRLQVNKEGTPIVIAGFEMVVPPQLEITARKILASDLLIGSTTADVPIPSRSVIPEFGIKLHVNEYLPIVSTTNGDTSWYLFARLVSGRAAQLNFLTGRRAPQLVMKAPDKVAVGGGALGQMEGDFWTDSNWWRVRHILGGTQVDPRMTWASDGTV